MRSSALALMMHLQPSLDLVLAHLCDDIGICRCFHHTRTMKASQGKAHGQVVSEQQYLELSSSSFAMSRVESPVRVLMSPQGRDADSRMQASPPLESP